MGQESRKWDAIGPGKLLRILGAGYANVFDLNKSHHVENASICINYYIPL